MHYTIGAQRNTETIVQVQIKKKRFPNRFNLCWEEQAFKLEVVAVCSSSASGVVPICFEMGKKWSDSLLSWDLYEQVQMQETQVEY
jgi:hypothetical protein